MLALFALFLGGDTVAATRFATQSLQSRIATLQACDCGFGVQVRTDEIDEMHTVGDLVSMIARKRRKEPWTPRG
jgi:hypothetical protein